jgi:hypothetical protein
MLPLTATSLVEHMLLTQLSMKQCSSTNFDDAQLIIPDLDTHEDTNGYAERKEKDDDGNDANVFGQAEYP